MQIRSGRPSPSFRHNLNDERGLPMNRKKKSARLSTYILISVLIFISAVLLSILPRMFLVLDPNIYSFSEGQAELVASMIEGIVGAIAAGLVLYQLKLSSAVEERENHIVEAQFILQYNQAFIQDQNMCQIEQLLERSMLHETAGPIITPENRQLFINYLVYLEGFTSLILRDVLPLEHIDDLFAYRYFLAINNRELQRDQLFQFPDYYRGCFCLYETWKAYRRQHHLEVLLYENSLDKWENYEFYLQDSIQVRPMQAIDNAQTAARLIYETDEYIYPAAFVSRQTAQRILPQWMAQEGFLFSREHLRVAVAEGRIVGIAVVLTAPPRRPIALTQVQKHRRALPASFPHTCEHYFNRMDAYFQDGTDVYLACLSVDRNWRGRRIGERLLKAILREHPHQKLKLHVLCDNQAATGLYRKYGFQICGPQEPGYAYRTEPPLCYQMLHGPDIRDEQ